MPACHLSFHSHHSTSKRIYSNNTSIVQKHVEMDIQDIKIYQLLTILYGRGNTDAEYQIYFYVDNFLCGHVSQIRCMDSIIHCMDQILVT